MIRRDIEAARKAGIIDDEKARELAVFFRGAANNAPTAAQAGTTSSDDEALRFLANFNDIFISIGIVLLSIGLMIGSGIVLGSTGNAPIIIAPVLVVLWLLLEYFAGHRRLLLPSMTLSLMITFIAMFLVSLLANGLGSVESAFNKIDNNIFESFTTIKNALHLVRVR